MLRFLGARDLRTVCVPKHRQRPNKFFCFIEKLKNRSSSGESRTAVSLEGRLRSRVIHLHSSTGHAAHRRLFDQQVKEWLHAEVVVLIDRKGRGKREKEFFFFFFF
jgi:hypothetical protein